MSLLLAGPGLSLLPPELLPSQSEMVRGSRDLVSTNHSSPEGVHVVVPEVVVGVVQAGDHQPAARHLRLDLNQGEHQNIAF